MSPRRKSSKGNATLTAAGLIVLIVLEIFYTLTGKDQTGAFDSGTPTASGSAPLPPDVPTSANAQRRRGGRFILPIRCT